MTEIVKNGSMFMEQDSGMIYINHVPPRCRKRRWSVMPVHPVRVDTPVDARLVPLRIRRAAKAHFATIQGTSNG